jgi:glyoxylase-like metal-dependent hydrolase (beta-lactamase superfamily II)
MRVREYRTGQPTCGMLRDRIDHRDPMTARLTFNTAFEFAYGEPSPVAPGIVRIVAKNPGPLTFKGTNTYLVGMTGLAVIDPGPDDEAHIDAIVRAANGRNISHILVTHAHRDHVDGAARLRALTGAKVCAFQRRPAAQNGKLHHPAQTEYVNTAIPIDLPVSNNDIIEGHEWAFDALHTPGHAPDHLCFALQKRGVVFSGDHVMAWNTTVVGPPEGVMSDYLRSLQRLLHRSRDKLYLPGHGERLEKPHRTVRAYLLHRRWREQSILSVIREEGGATIPTIVANVYDGLAPNLVPAAALSVLGHVEHLIEQGFVACEGEPTFDRRLYPA